MVVGLVTRKPTSPWSVGACRDLYPPRKDNSTSHRRVWVVNSMGGFASRRVPSVLQCVETPRHSVFYITESVSDKLIDTKELIYV